MSVVIAHRNIEMAEELCSLVLDLGIPLPGPIRTFDNMADVRADLDTHGEPLLFITDVDLPDGGSQSGVALAREIQTRWSNTPICFLAPAHYRELSNSLIGLSSIALVFEGRNLAHEFQYSVRRMLAPRGIPLAPGLPRPARYDVTFRLCEDGNCSYDVRSFNTQNPHTLQLRFGVDPQRLNALIERAKNLPHNASWKEDFQLIGSELVKALIKEQADVVYDLGILEGIKLTSSSKIGLCFSVDRKFFPIPFESIGIPRSRDHHYWLEKSPLWRRLPDFPIDQLPLFSYSNQRPLPVNCLMIDANCGGTTHINIGASGAASEAMTVEVKLPGLTGIKPEIDEIKKEAMKAPPATVGRIGHIWMKNGVVYTEVRNANGHIEPPGPSGTFEQVLKTLLTDGEPWHLVHFAGHSHFTSYKNDEFGYVFLPVPGHIAEDMSQPKAIGIPLLAQWLQRTRFVYLSGCVSAHHDFAYHLCGNNVPAMSGFRWALDDDLACTHSANFYSALFKTRSIEQALQETWVDMYAKHRNNRAWASSQFVIHSAA